MSRRKKKKDVHSVKEMKERISLLFFVLFTLTLLSSLYAHDGVDHDSEEEVENHYYQGFSAVMPFVYFAQGEYFTGILVCVLWFGVIYGFYNLLIMILGRATHEEKKK